MTRRSAIVLLSGAINSGIAGGRGLAALLPPERGCALLVDAVSGRIIASNSAPAMAHGAYPPGSAIKPFVLASLMAAGSLRAGEKFYCPERLSIEGRRMDCSHPRLGAPLDVSTALAYSCNCFVAHAAERFPAGALAAALKSLGFSAVEARRDQRLQALGEAGVEVSPAEMALAYRRLGRGKTSEAIVSGLEGAVEYGTGQLAATPWARVAGKTGSARRGTEFIAWFAGFAPSRSPGVVVTVMLAGKHGSSDAAPVARGVLEAWKAGPV